MSEVLVAGRGLAALTCAVLLARQGRSVRIIGTEATGRRWLVLPEAVTELLCEVWDTHAEVLDSAGIVRHRSVRWGDTDGVQVSARSHTLEGTALNQRLAAYLARNYGDQVQFDGSTPLSAVALPPAGDATRPGWVVAAARLPTMADFRAVGRRHIITAEVQLTSRCDSATCFMETTRHGWVYLAPVGQGSALVQAMVPGPVHNSLPVLCRLLAETRLGARLVEPPVHASVVRAAPGLLAPLCGPGWFAAGSAAVQFDPLSGCGSAQAARTAILAAAAIDAIERGHAAQEVREYYTARIRVAFAEHLQSCLRLYETTFPSESWQDEIDATKVTLRALADTTPHTAFMLSECTLQRRR